MNSRQWLEDLKKSPVKKGLPILSFPSVSITGVTVRELVQNSSLQAEGMKTVADRIPSAASVSMMDLSVEAEAFGSAIKTFEREVPVVTDEIVQDERSADALKIPHVGDARTGLFVEAVEKACKLITDRPVLAGAAGPFSLCGRLMGISKSMIHCVKNPQMVHTTMKKVTPFLIEYVKAFRDAGANGLIMAEPLTGLLSPKLAKEFSEPYAKEIVDAVQDDSFIIVYHNCGGSVPRMMDSLLRVGAAAYHFGNAVSMKDVLTKLPENVIAMGNIDPSSQFCMGTPQSMREAVLLLMKECCPDFPNFVISSGCDIAVNAKWENITAFFDAIEEYNNTAK